MLFILARLLDIYSLVVLGAVIASWFRLSPDHPVSRLSNLLVEPVLAPIRRMLPSFGGLDLSPIVLIFGIHFLRRLLGS